MITAFAIYLAILLSRPLRVLESFRTTTTRSVPGTGTATAFNYFSRTHPVTSALTSPLPFHPRLLHSLRLIAAPSASRTLQLRSLAAYPYADRRRDLHLARSVLPYFAIAIRPAIGSTLAFTYRFVMVDTPV